MAALYDPPSNRRQAKSAAAFRTISEVSEELEVPQHVLRFWESKFSQVRPLKRGGGRRYYRPEDVVLLRRIRQCLYDDGYTIRGVQRLLREGQLRAAGGSSEGALTEPESPISPEADVDLGRPKDPHRELQEIRAELTRLRDLLRRSGIG